MVEFTSATQHSPLPKAHRTPHPRVANSPPHFGNNDIVINHADVNIAAKNIKHAIVYGTMKKNANLHKSLYLSPINPSL
jgi:hypothetical protein